MFEIILLNSDNGWSLGERGREEENHRTSGIGAFPMPPEQGLPATAVEEIGGMVGGGNGFRYIAPREDAVRDDFLDNR